MAGGLVMEAARHRGVSILPVDSEHNAIHQCAHGRDASEIARIILTASGGPFRGRDARSLSGVSADEALRHPTWRMGRKITIDSATLMNKGLEVIEAHWLFDLLRADRRRRPPAVGRALDGRAGGRIDHRQLGVTDMRLPIQYAFAYPERWTGVQPPLDFARCGGSTSSRRISMPFPVWALPIAPAVRPKPAGVLNAANEVAVAAFSRAGSRLRRSPASSPGRWTRINRLRCSHLQA